MTRSISAPPLDAHASEWLVYGDALQEAGDPRGELIGLSHAVDERRTDPAVRDAYVAEHATALLGEAAPHLKAYRFDWRFCAPLGVEVRIGPGDPDAVGPLLASQLAPSLRSITLVGVPDPGKPVSLERAMQALANRPPAACTSFEFVDDRAARASMLVSRDFEPDTNLVTLGPLAPFFAIAEHLRLVVADGHQVDLEKIVAPKLRSFTLDSLRFAEWDDAGVMASRLGAAQWPALESLELRLVETWGANIPLETNPYVAVYSERDEDDEDDDGSRYEDEADEGETEGIDWHVLGELLRSVAKGPLRRLALTSFDSATSLLETLAEVGLPPATKELVLSDSNLGDTDAEWMTRHPDLFGSLDRLVVERTSITERGRARLETLGPAIVHSHRGGPRYRYVVGQE